MTHNRAGMAVVVALAVAPASRAGAAGAANLCTWNGNFVATGRMNAERAGHTSTLLVDGRVLVAGGSSRTTTTAATDLYDPRTGTFSATGSLTSPRYFHTATRLDDGRVLVTGGSGGAWNLGATASAERWDPASGSSSAVGTMARARLLHTATLLPGGKVLLVGGMDLSSRAVAEAELYDPATGAFTVVASLQQARFGHTATLLGDGSVLVVGGSSGGASALATAERFVPGPGTGGGAFQPAGTMAGARENHAAVLLPGGGVLVVGGSTQGVLVSGAEVWTMASYGPTFGQAGSLLHPREYLQLTLLGNGHVLVTGGSDAVGPLDAVEVWSGSPGSFQSAGSLVQARLYHTATLLQQGQVLIAGGMDVTQTAVTKGAELYDPVWVATEHLQHGRSRHTATLLLDGRVLLAGGQSAWTQAPLAEASAEIYDPATGHYTLVPMQAGRMGHSATLLADGRVLIAGGRGQGGPTGSAEIFDPTTNSFSATASLAAARSDHAAARLADGRVLVTGGVGASIFSSTEIFQWDPATQRGTFAAGPPMVRDRRTHTATLVSTGKVIVAGGWSTAVQGITYSVEQYDPAANSFSLLPQPSFMVVNREGHTATALPSSPDLMVVGGLTSGLVPTASVEGVPAGVQGRMANPRIGHATSDTLLPGSPLWVIGGQAAFSGGGLSATEFVDPVGGSTRPGEPLPDPRVNHTATLLKDGRILVVGGAVGYDGWSNSGEISKTTDCRVWKKPPRLWIDFLRPHLPPLPPDRRPWESFAALVNKGKVRSEPLTLRYFLVSRGDVERRFEVAKRRIPQLAPGARFRDKPIGRPKVRFPSGSYEVQACITTPAGVGRCASLHAGAEIPRHEERHHFPRERDEPPMR